MRFTSRLAYCHGGKQSSRIANKGAECGTADIRHRYNVVSASAGAVGARNGSQRSQPPPDPARLSQTVHAGQGLPVRPIPTVADTPEFPDTEEVTGSNPVRPTIFENPSRNGSQKGSQNQIGLASLMHERRFARVMTVVVT